MKGKKLKEGKFEVFESDHGNEILMLDEEKWYALEKGQKGDIIVHTNSDHQKSKTLKKGQYYLVDFEGDPSFNDHVSHLFMENGDDYKEFILPNGFPTSNTTTKKLVRPDEKISKEKLHKHVN